MLSQCLRIQAEIISKCFGYKKKAKKNTRKCGFFSAGKLRIVPPFCRQLQIKKYLS